MYEKQGREGNGLEREKQKNASACVSACECVR